MPNTTRAEIAVIGIDMTKNSFHVVGRNAQEEKQPAGTASSAKAYDPATHGAVTGCDESLMRDESFDANHRLMPVPPHL